MPHATHSFVATCTAGGEGVLADELAEIGAEGIRPLSGAVAFEGPMEIGYRACLWSRVASRCLVELGWYAGTTPEALYEAVRAIPWTEHMGVEDTLAVDFVGTSRTIRNSHFGAMRTKDAIVDAIREVHDARPSVDLEAPDLRVHIHLASGGFTVSLDLAGDPLHRRGYIREAGAAPIKENLAALILRLGEWPEAARHGAPLVDPMCGSGTFLMEAAGMALDRAPGLGRVRWGFTKWRQHQPELWERLVAEAEERKAAANHRPVEIYGADRDPELLRLTKVNLARSEVNARVKRSDIRDTVAPPSSRTEPPFGLVVTNPPYGERLGDKRGAEMVGKMLGNSLRRGFRGWRVLVIAGSPELVQGIGLPDVRQKQLWNGPIECRLVQYDVGS